MDGLELKYFVLKPRSKHPDDMYARASRKAITAYADTIKGINKELSDYLMSWVRNEISYVESMKR